MEQKAFPFLWPERRGMDDFIVAECNAVALEQVINPNAWASPILYILGPTASGKSHLATIFKEKTKADNIETLAELDDAIQSEPDFLVMDNVDMLCANKEAQEKLFHLYNNVTARAAKLLLSAATPPDEWVVLPDLLSRLNASAKVFLDNPDEKMVKAAFQKLFGDRGMLVDDAALNFLALRSERSFAKIRALVDVLDQAALAEKRRLTRPFVSQILNQHMGE